MADELEWLEEDAQREEQERLGLERLKSPLFKLGSFPIGTIGCLEWIFGDRS
jgi:hypothetical protein